MTAKKTKEVPVLVGTETRNLWSGYVTGPSAGCRIGPAVPEVQARRVTTVAMMTPEAVVAFEAAPWRS